MTSCWAGLSGCRCAFSFSDPLPIFTVQTRAGEQRHEEPASLHVEWLWLRTESIWIAALAHGALNNWGQYAFKFMDDGGAGGEARDMLVLAAGGLGLLAVGSLLLAYGLSEPTSRRASVDDVA
jgi:hypothetical protein